MRQGPEVSGAWSFCACTWRANTGRHLQAAVCGGGEGPPLLAAQDRGVGSWVMVKSERRGGEGKEEVGRTRRVNTISPLFS